MRTSESEYRVLYNRKKGKWHIYRSSKNILKNCRTLSEKKKGMVEGYIQGLKDQNDEEDNKKEKLSESKIG